jgi:hypothetical protein
LGDAARSNATTALLLPSLAQRLNLDLRAEMMAISAMANKPFADISRHTIVNSNPKVLFMIFLVHMLIFFDAPENQISQGHTIV